MDEPKPLKFGDKSPVTGQPLVAALVPTAAEYARLGDRENPIALSRFHDTASEAFRKEHGALYYDPFSGYRTRFPLDQIKAPKRNADQAD